MKRFIQATSGILLTTLLCVSSAVAQGSAADIIKTMEDRMRGELSY